MSTAHLCKDNGSPTSVAHKLGDDQTDSVVVRRDDLVVIDNAALGTLCEDVQIASRRNAGVLEVEWFRNGAELTLFQTFANRAAAAAQHEETWTGQGFTARVASSCRHVRTVVYGSVSAPHGGASIETYEPLGAPFRRPRAGPAHERFRIRCDMDLVGDRAAARAFILGRQDLARDDTGVLDVQLYVSGRKATLLATYADATAQQRSYMRWMKTDQAAVDEAIRVTGMYTYGRVELEPRGPPPPPGWTELMLAMHHQEPVGRCFQR